MANEIHLTRQPVELRALFVGQRLNMRALEQSKRLASSPFVIHAGAGGYAVMFRYGVVVLFNLNAIEEAGFLKSISDFILEPFNVPEIEEAVIHIRKDETQEGAGPEGIVLNGWDIERLQIIADIFAKSAVLAYYEKQMAVTFDSLEPIAEHLQNGKISGRRSRDLIKHIGVTLSIQRKMVGHVQIEEKPDPLWDRPDLERLFQRLEDEYELIERHTALKHKLDLVYKTAETLLGVLQERRTLHVEWYIVILIVIDIVISMVEKALAH